VLLRDRGSQGLAEQLEQPNPLLSQKGTHHEHTNHSSPYRMEGTSYPSGMALHMPGVRSTGTREHTARSNDLGRRAQVREERTMSTNLERLHEEIEELTTQERRDTIDYLIGAVSAYVPEDKWNAATVRAIAFATRERNGR
jgi:hypothetical protein